jgi:hypothetical protein
MASPKQKIADELKISVDQFGDEINAAFNKIHSTLVALKPRIDACDLSDTEKHAL